MFITLFIQTLPVSSTTPVRPYYTNPAADTSSMLQSNCGLMQEL